MAQKLLIGASQSHTLPTTQQTLEALESTTQLAASKDISILLFPEAYLGGYPRRCDFGAAVGSRSDAGREQFLQYFKSAVDLGDTPVGAGDDWIHRRLPRDARGVRGDGTREELERIARQTGVFIVTGLVERSGGSLYCACVYVDPMRGILGKRRKVMPTGTERLVWAQGSPSTLKAVVATIKGVRVVMAAAICWENYMPLLRYSLYSQNINLWLAPTADPRATWEPLMKTIGLEGRCFVLSANQCIRHKDLPHWIMGTTYSVDRNGVKESTTQGMPNGKTGSVRSPSASERRRSMTARTAENHEIVWQPKAKDGESIAETDGPDDAVTTTISSVAEQVPPMEMSDASENDFASRGGSCIISPMGQTLEGPVWDIDEGEDSLICTEVDFDDCDRGRLDFDAAGSYSRNDAFRLTVEGLDLVPPP